eukprot:1556761-Prymnesium_polylepis.1
MLNSARSYRPSRPQPMKFIRRPSVATASAARSWPLAEIAPITTTLSSTKEAGTMSASTGPGEPCSTSPIAIAGFSSGCMNAKKVQNEKGAVRSSPETPAAAMACHWDAKLAKAGACTAVASAVRAVAASTGQLSGGPCASTSSGIGVSTESSMARVRGGAASRSDEGRWALKLVTSGVAASTSATSERITRARVRSTMASRRSAESGDRAGKQAEDDTRLSGFKPTEGQT